MTRGYVPADPVLRMNEIEERLRVLEAAANTQSVWGTSFGGGGVAVNPNAGGGEGLSHRAMQDVSVAPVTNDGISTVWNSSTGKFEGRPGGTQHTFHFAGPLYIITTDAVHLDADGYIVSAQATVTTAPTNGAGAVFAVLKNGGVIGSVTIPVGQFVATVQFLAVPALAIDLIQGQCQVTAGAAGGTLQVRVA